MFDYVDNDDSDIDCAPDPAGQSGLNNSTVSGGGRWHLRVWEDDPGDNHHAVRFNFSGYHNAADCSGLNAELAVMGLTCGCDDAGNELLRCMVPSNLDVKSDMAILKACLFSKCEKFMAIAKRY